MCVHIHSLLPLPLLLPIHPLHLSHRHAGSRRGHPPGPIVSEALFIMYGHPADPSEPNNVGVYVVYSVTRTPSDAHWPP